MNEENEVTLTKLAKVLDTELSKHPPLDECLTPEEFVNLWKYARIKDCHQMLGLLAFGEMLTASTSPLHAFAGAMLNWLDDARAVIRAEEHDEQAGDTTEVLH